MLLAPVFCLAGVLTTICGQPSVAQATAVVSPDRLSEQMQQSEQILSLHPEDSAARTNESSTAIALALDARRQGHLEEALSYLLRADKWVPKDATLLLDTGVLEEQMHLYNDSDKALTEAYRIEPDNLKILYAMARVKMDLGQLQASESAWKLYLQRRPEDASAHYGYGLLLLFNGQPQLAQAQFETSLTLDPHQAESRYRLGEIARNEGDMTQAQNDYRDALAIDPRHPGALTGIGILEFQAKLYQQAANDLKQAVEIAPTFQTAHYYYALCLKRLGDNAASEKQMAIAVQLANDLNSQKDDRRHLATGSAASSQTASEGTP